MLGSSSSTQTASTASSVAAANEDGQPGEQAPLVVEEEVVAPVHDRPQRLLAGQRGAGAAGQQREAVAESLVQRGQGEGSKAGGCKLDGQGQAVETSADAVDDRFGRAAAFECRLDRTSTVHEELDGGRGCQPGDGNEDFAGNTEWLAARRHETKAGKVFDQGAGEARGLVDDVFAVVEDDKERPPGEVAGDELGRRPRGLGVTQSRPHGSERAGRSRGDPFGIGHASQFDQPDAARVLFLQAGRGRERQSGLAHPTGSDQCDQAAGGNGFANLFQFGVTAQESAQWFG